MILKLEYKFIEHPYKEESSSKEEKWSEIRLKLFDQSNKLIKVIIDIQWDILVFLEWAIENQQALLNEKIALKTEGSSIAKAVFDFYENLDPEKDSEDFINSVYSYRKRHGIRFSLRGTNVDDIYIGQLMNVSTISFYDSKSSWNFNIEMDEFFQESNDLLKKIRG